MNPCPRIRSSSGHRIGTIRYRGPVEVNSNKEWLGIEWDEDGQGKHDDGRFTSGEVIFTCPGTKRASFVRPDKVQCAISLERALRDKYCNTVVDHHMSMDVIKVSKDVPTSLSELRNVCLENDNVGYGGETLDVARGITVLNLSRCLLHSWHDVLDILARLPNAEEFVASRNSLAVSSSSIPPLQFPPIHNLKTLVLDQVKDLPISQICPATFPGLQRLYYRSNHLTDDDCMAWLSNVAVGFISLVELDLSHNELKDMANLFAHVPSTVQRLSVAGNPLNKIPSPLATHALSIKILNMPDTLISTQDYTSLDTLRCWLPSLLELRLTPQNDVADDRYAIIARLPTLQVLHGSVISLIERNDAERIFVRKAEETNTMDHGLFRMLLDKHGSQYVAPKPTSQNVIQVEFMDVGVVGTSATRKLPMSSSRADVIRVAHRLLRRTTVSGIRVGSCEWVEDDKRVLSDFIDDNGVQTNVQIFIT